MIFYHDLNLRGKLKNKISYNGWIIFLIVIGILCLDDIAAAFVIFSAIIYVIYIEKLNSEDGRTKNK